jgi:hypothetical protein
MSNVNLEDQEWQRVMNILSTAAWRDVNDLLMKIGGQLRAQDDMLQRVRPNTNSGREASDERTN